MAKFTPTTLTRLDCRRQSSRVVNSVHTYDANRVGVVGVNWP